MIITIAKVTLDSGSFYKIGYSASAGCETNPKSSAFYTYLKDYKVDEVYTRTTQDAKNLVKTVLRSSLITKFPDAANYLIDEKKNKPIGGAKKNCFKTDNISLVIDLIKGTAAETNLCFYKKGNVLEIKMTDRIDPNADEVIQMQEDVALAKIEFYTKYCKPIASSVETVTFNTLSTAKEVSSYSKVLQVFKEEGEEDIYRIKVMETPKLDAVWSYGVVSGGGKLIKNIYKVTEKVENRLIKSSNLIKSLDKALLIPDNPTLLFILKCDSLYKFYRTSKDLQSAEEEIQRNEMFKGFVIETTLEIKKHVTIEYLMTLVKPFNYEHNTFRLIGTMDELLETIKLITPGKSDLVPTLYIVSFSDCFRVGLVSGGSILDIQKLPNGAILTSSNGTESQLEKVLKSLGKYRVRKEIPGHFFGFDGLSSAITEFNSVIRS